MIGGGVVGVTSALQLLQKGYKVTVVAKEFASPVASGKCITSEIAGALWEWPPAVCGRHTDEKSLERSKVWCMDSYGKFMELAMKPKEIKLERTSGNRSSTSRTWLKTFQRTLSFARISS